MQEQKKLRLAVMGCGGRGTCYSELAGKMGHLYEVVAAVDPSPQRLSRVIACSGNPGIRRFDSDEAFFGEPRMADVLIVATQDALHVEQSVRGMECGYDILLEKPIGQSLDDVFRIEACSRRLGRKVLVCHVLRYTPFYQAVKGILDSGELGEVVSMNATEGVEPWHHCHSYVRGHWSRSRLSAPMIISKSCHDLDLLVWLSGRRSVRVSSFGSLSHFTAAHAPQGAPARCVDGCPHERTCPYSAFLYVNRHKSWVPYVVANPDPSDAEVLDWIHTSPWGRCVYRCQNDVVDHQIVAVEFDGGLTATFTMTAFERERSLEVFGSRAVLRGGGHVRRDCGSDLVIEPHDGPPRHVTIDRIQDACYSGHEGGDAGLMNALHEQMTRDGADMTSSLENSIESHVMGFAAEHARLSGVTVCTLDLASGFSDNDTFWLSGLRDSGLMSKRGEQVSSIER